MSRGPTDVIPGPSSPSQSQPKQGSSFLRGAGRTSLSSPRETRTPPPTSHSIHGGSHTAESRDDRGHAPASLGGGWRTFWGRWDEPTLKSEVSTRHTGHVKDKHTWRLQIHSRHAAWLARPSRHPAGKVEATLQICRPWGQEQNQQELLPVLCAQVLRTLPCYKGNLVHRLHISKYPPQSSR